MRAGLTEVHFLSAPEVPPCDLPGWPFCVTLKQTVTKLPRLRGNSSVWMPVCVPFPFRTGDGVFSLGLLNAIGEFSIPDSTHRSQLLNVIQPDECLGSNCPVEGPGFGAAGEQEWQLIPCWVCNLMYLTARLRMR